MVYANLHERYHFIERHVPMNKNEVIRIRTINKYGLFQNSRCEINYR